MNTILIDFRGEDETSNNTFLNTIKQKTNDEFGKREYIEASED